MHFIKSSEISQSIIIIKQLFRKCQTPLYPLNFTVRVRFSRVSFRAGQGLGQELGPGYLELGSGQGLGSG